LYQSLEVRDHVILICTATFYARKQLLRSARLSHHNSVRSSVCHTGGSVKNGSPNLHRPLPGRL